MWRCDQRYGLRGVLFNGREHSARGILAADHKHSGTDDAKRGAGPVVSTQGQSCRIEGRPCSSGGRVRLKTLNRIRICHRRSRFGAGIARNHVNEL